MISKRIELLISEKKLSKRAFSRSVNCTDTAINNIISGRNEPGFKILEAILQTYDDISPDWLLTGIGDMYRQNTPQNTPGGGTVPIEVYMESQKQVTELIKMLSSTQDQLGKMIGISKDLANKGNGAPLAKAAGCADVG